MRMTAKTTMRTTLVLLVILALSLLPLVASALAVGGVTQLISAGPEGIGGSSSSSRPSISADGKLIVFESFATDLIADRPTNGNANIFVFDTTTGETTLITRGPAGMGGDDVSMSASISADGKWVAFMSLSTDLIAGQPTNGERNIFLYDMSTGITTLVTAGEHDAGGDESSNGPSLSADGTLIVFESYATDLIDGSTTNGESNIFVYDRTADEISLITTGTHGNGGEWYSYSPSISADGRWVAFHSIATDLIAGFPTNDNINIFVYDLLDEEMMLVTKGSSGDGGDSWSWSPTISDDGRYIAYDSFSSDLVGGLTTSGLNVFRYDRTEDTTTLISSGAAGTGGNGQSRRTSISADGTRVIYISKATDLTTGPAANGKDNVFLYDVITQTTTLVTGGAAGVGGNANTVFTEISADGDQVLFCSGATDLIAGKTTKSYNVFLWEYTLVVEVTFDAQDGSTPLTKTIVQGTSVAEPEPPRRANYPFNGWWTAPKGGELWDFDTPVWEDMTLYAQWGPEFKDEGVGGLPTTVPNAGDETEIDNSLYWMLGAGAATILVAIAYWLFTRKKGEPTPPVVEEAILDEVLINDGIEDSDDIKFVTFDLD